MTELTTENTTEPVARPTSRLPDRKFPIITELDESQLKAGISGVEAGAAGLPVLISDDWDEIHNPLRRSFLPEEFVAELKLDDRFVRIQQPPHAPMEDRQAMAFGFWSRGPVRHVIGHQET